MLSFIKIGPIIKKTFSKSMPVPLIILLKIVNICEYVTEHALYFNKKMFYAHPC